MKLFISLIAALCCPVFVFCQDITGLWKGTMLNDSSGQSIEYEVVIRKETRKFTGFSHTWFLIQGKKYYGIKKIHVRIARDGKIILQDASLIANNYPVQPNKEVRQLNVLDWANTAENATLDGIFVTNRSKEYRELTGHISLKRVSKYTQSDLVSYLQKNNMDIAVAVVK